MFMEGMEILECPEIVTVTVVVVVRTVSSFDARTRRPYDRLTSLGRLVNGSPESGEECARSSQDDHD